MKFILRENLKKGMRLARPIYSRDATLLYNIGSRLTDQGIASVNNFGIIGLYILDEAEPTPPMSDDEIALEKFQVASTTRLYSDWDKIRSGRVPAYLHKLAAEIISKYGNLDHKITFFQTIRSNGDKYYKHCLNSAILSAMICHKMGKKSSDMNTSVISALLHDIGKLDIPKPLASKSEDELSESEHKELFTIEYKGTNYLETKQNDMPAIRTIMGQHIRLRRMERLGKVDEQARWYTDTAKILTVACAFDRLTSMNIGKEPTSELTAIRMMRHNPDFFDGNAVDALVESVNVLVAGCSVVLTNGLTGCVIKENRFNISKPVVLLFDSNTIMDLSDVRKHGTLAVKDVMKTLDNRWVIDRDFIKSYFTSLKK